MPGAILSRIVDRRRPVLLQFGKNDPYVPVKTAEALSNAAHETKRILWYDAGHGLNAAAIRDRQDWLRARLSGQHSR